MKKTYYYYILILVSIVVGMLALITPKVKDDENKFSANDAFEDILEIAQVPHTVEDHTALAEVRDYLFDELDVLGLNPTITTHLQTDEEYNMTEVNNILAQIDGDSNSYILLLAHYDSSPAKRIGEEAGSKGAADDGYGLSTILETLRTLQNNNVEFTNGIKILFTDGEEVGLYGAEKEVENNPSWFEDISIVLNIEARGVKGPNIMFQTSLENYKVIKFFSHAKYPVSFSLAGDVYSNMPNSTDLTPMLDHGLAGINMSVLDNLDYYHTPKDNPDNVSLTSLQHYGENIYPLVNEFVTNEQYSDVDYFDDDSNAMYFTFLPNVFIVFHQTTQVVLAIITFIALGFLLFLAHKNEEFRVGKLLIWNAIWFGFMIGSLLIGYILSQIFGMLFDIPFNLFYMPNIPFSLGITILSILGITLLMVLLLNKTKENIEDNVLQYSGLTFLAVFTLIFLFVLPGGTYLFLLPLFIATISLLVNYFLRQKEIGNERTYNVIETINIVFPVVLYSPILYLLYLALTIGALGAILLFLTFPLVIVFPQIYKLSK